jgi:hypothetical protein
MDTLPIVDASSIAEELELNVKARISGGRDLPNNNETTLDGTEKEIVDRIAMLNSSGRSAAVGTVNRLLEQFAEIMKTPV